MFDRIRYEEWQMIFPIAGLLLLLGIFTLLVIRVARLPRSKIRHLAKLPFDEEENGERHELEGKR